MQDLHDCFFLHRKAWTPLYAKKIDIIFFYFQVNNEGAIGFYKNFGFDIVETKEQYYKKIEPADAYVLEKKLRWIFYFLENTLGIRNPTIWKQNVFDFGVLNGQLLSHLEWCLDFKW